MTELAVVEKSPDSWRIDHPDFPTVCQVSYAKGVITDFKRPAVDNPDDPFRVESMVKVEIEGVGESDFIPLFYHPRKQYWDTEDHKAQDINQDEKYFENAWMSFRVDDEVKVMLQDGKPFAVVGFLDGIPRIGEDIIRMMLEAYDDEAHKLYLQCSKQGEMYGNLDSEGKGPDGMDLGLVNESEVICDTGIETTVIGPGPWEYDTQSTVYNDKRYFEWLIIVGPIMYIFQAIGARNRSFSIYTPGTLYWVSYPDGRWTEWFYDVTMISVLAAPYTKKLYEEVKALGQSHSGMSPLDIDEGFVWEGERGYFLEFPEFKYQDKFSVNLVNNENINHWSWRQPDSIHETDPSKIKFYTRPHTKEELQTAGFWPGAT